MGALYFCVLISIVMFIFLIKISIKLYRDAKKAERLKHKLNREDWILHDLTACDED